MPINLGDPVPQDAIVGQPVPSDAVIGPMSGAPPVPQGTPGLRGTALGIGKGLLSTAADTMNWAGGLTPQMWATQLGARLGGLPATNQLAGIPTPQPQGTAEKVGYWGEKGAEMAAPLFPIGEGALTLARNLPNMPRAGAALEAIEQRIGQTPIDTSNVMTAAQRAKELSEAGHGTSAPVTAFLRRMSPKEMPYPGAPDQPAAMTFQEGRDLYSAAKDFTANELQNMTGKMQHQVIEFKNQLGQSLQNAATSMGEGTYAPAMQEYAKASTLQERIDVLKKWGIPALLGGGGGYTLLRKLGVIP